MSEAAGRQEIWVEKYRPDSLDDIAGHEDIVSRLESYVAKDDLPHLLFAGPAGTGKCLVGDTPVLSANGLERIEDAVGDVEGFDEPADGLQVASFTDDGSFEFTEPSKVFSRDADETVTVETRDGGEFTVTPEHPLLTVTADGLSWTAAENLDPDSRIARPLHAPTPPGTGRTEWYEALDGDRTLVHLDSEFTAEAEIPIEENYVGTKQRVVAGFRRGDSIDTIAANNDTPRETVKAYARDVSDTDLNAPSSVCTLGTLRDRFSFSEIRRHVESIQYVTPTNNRSAPITPAAELDAELGRFLGLLVSEAYVAGGRVRFYNTDETLLEQFESTLAERFNLEPERRERKGVPYVEVISRTLTHYLESCFGVADDGFASSLLRSGEATRRAFLRAMLDSEAYVDERGTVEVSQKNDALLTSVSYLLASFGVPSRRKREWKAATNGSGTKREYHTLSISGASHLGRLRDEIGFSIEEKRQALNNAISDRGNPNHDTIPVQRSVDILCDRLNLPKHSLVGELDSPVRAREKYREQLQAVVDAANDRLDAANQAAETVSAMESALQTVSATPAAWVGTRKRLTPLDERKRIAETVGVRTDRLLEYSDGRRTPEARRVGRVLRELGGTEPPVKSVQQALREARSALSVSYESLAEGTDYRGVDVNNLLNNDDHGLRSLTRFKVVANQLERSANAMLSFDVLAHLRSLELVAAGDLYYDQVESVRREDGSTRVYDLTIPETHNFVAGNVPTVMHNTTAAVSIAREIYGEDWRENFLELNASDERGIDVVRDRIKNFARTSFGGYDYRIIFLDEADALTNDAQSALRRTMEQFSNNTRFILSCNYSSRIIDPIQSRCAVFRFSKLDDDAVADRVRYIAEKEGVEYTADGVGALVYAADGDMRRAVNALQAAAATDEVVDEEAVYAITATARPEEIEAMVTDALDGDFLAARSTLDDLLSDRGLAGGDIIDQLHRSVWEFDIEERAAVHLMDRVGEADYRIAEGANEQVQLEAMLASIALENGE